MSWHLLNTLYWLKLCVPYIINERPNTAFTYHSCLFTALIYYCDTSERKKKNTFGIKVEKINGASKFFKNPISYVTWSDIWIIIICSYFEWNFTPLIQVICYS